MGRCRTAEEVEEEYLNAMGPNLGPFYHLLWNECVSLQLEWEECKVLFGTNPERIDLLNESAPEFFGRLQNSLWERTLLQIARLMDPPSSGAGKCNVSLRTLPELVDRTIRHKIETLLKDAQKKGAFCKDWRDKIIAHRDLNLARGKNAKQLETASTLNVDSALGAIAAVLNEIESHYCNGRTVAYEHTHSPLGAIALLDVLQDGLEAQAAARERLSSGQLLPEDLAPKRAI
jgi:AbiU2